MSDMEDKLEAIAEKIAVHANMENVLFKDRLDAFKALTSYQFNKHKPKKTDPDTPEEETFNGFRNKVAASADGASEARPVGDPRANIKVPLRA